MARMRMLTAKSTHVQLPMRMNRETTPIKPSNPACSALLSSLKKGRKPPSNSKKDPNCHDRLQSRIRRLKRGDRETAASQHWVHITHLQSSAVTPPGSYAPFTLSLLLVFKKQSSPFLIRTPASCPMGTRQWGRAGGAQGRCSCL